MTFRAEFEHRDALLRAALDEFCERGFDAASINRILVASGMSKGQLYHHFGSKEGLYLALVEWTIDQKLDWFTNHPVAPAPTFLADLGARLAAALAFAAAHPDVDRMARALLAERGRPIFDAVTTRFAFGPDSALASQIRDAHARGELRRQVPVELAERLVLLVLNRAPELFDVTGPADMHAAGDQLVDVLARGLAAEPAARRDRSAP